MEKMAAARNSPMKVRSYCVAHAAIDAPPQTAGPAPKQVVPPRSASPMTTPASGKNLRTDRAHRWQHIR